jgi:glycosyltransferase involved in cell wall biosynthesis
VTKLVFVTQQLDAAHPTLGAAAAMVGALADRVDEVVVFAARSAPGALPDNVRFRSFDAPTQALRGLRFEAALAREIAHGRPVALLAHMSPIYAVLAAPLARPLRIPLLLWFTQQRAGPALARAERVVDAILTVDARSVPLDSPKVRAIGHGIDLRDFPYADRTPPDGRLRLLSLGRYSEVKGHDLALRGLRHLLDRGVDAELVVRGEEATPNDAAVRVRLQTLAGTLSLQGHAKLLDPLPRTEIPALYAATDVLVNATRGGAADKVVYEASATGLPVVASSAVFDALLPEELRFPDGDDGALADRLEALPGDRLPALGRELRERVVQGHSVEHWADAVLATARR